MSALSNLLIPAVLFFALGILTRLIRKGHHLTVFVSDVSVLGPEKYDAPMD